MANELSIDELANEYISMFNGNPPNVTIKIKGNSYELKSIDHGEFHLNQGLLKTPVVSVDFYGIVLDKIPFNYDKFHPQISPDKTAFRIGKMP